jgi:cysteine desulfurase/selenocysteine lyase
MDWNAVRQAEFPVSERWAYFDHAAVAPLPQRSGEALRLWIADQQANGVMNWLKWEKKLDGLRRDLADLIHASTAEIAFVGSTTHGIGLVAEGFPWNVGDNVVTAEEEYPSNLYPWMNLASRGVELRTVPSHDGCVRVEDLAAAIDSRTRVLTISHVEFASGFRNNLEMLAELCQRRGVALFVDAIQGLGPLTIDVEKTPIDFLCADGHKWLLGPEGAGFLYIRKSWIDRLRPLGVGWHSVTSSYNAPKPEFTLKPNAQRWEGGSYIMPGLQALAASVRLFHDIGPKLVSERILDRAEAVRQLARSAGWTVFGSNRPEDQSGIVPLTKEGVDPDAFARSARDRGIALACRRGRVRISAHIYNNSDDLERLREALS